jgi:undecaprenyl diphosphate synthase
MVSIYALSTENIHRDKKELDGLWNIYKKEFQEVLHNKKIRDKGIRINILGNSAIWRSDVRQAAKAVMTSTKNYTRGVVNIMLAYGSKFEILESAKKMLKAGVKRIPFAEETFVNFMEVNRPVDLVIRTGGEHRLSNFLLYQSAYAEIYFSDTLWPDFSKKELVKIIKWYKKRNKKFGL